MIIHNCPTTTTTTTERWLWRSRDQHYSLTGGSVEGKLQQKSLEASQKCWVIHVRSSTWIPEQHCRQDMEVRKGESHYSSSASRGHLTINWDKHWWPLSYPWQWPWAEQNQTLALSSSLSWEWHGAPCTGQMTSGEGANGARWSLEAEIPLRKPELFAWVNRGASRTQ